MAKVFDGRQIVFSEESDTAFYNDLGIENVLFFDGKDKLSAFHNAKNTNQLALVDRDYLTDDEIKTLQETYPFLKILPFYSIENLLYHPDNLYEYYSVIDKPFNKKSYLEALEKEKNEQLPYIAAGISKARDGYPFYKENEYATKLKTFRGGTKGIIDMLKSDFDTFFKIYPAKDYGKTIAERQNLRKTDLIKTKWFKQQISKTIS